MSSQINAVVILTPAPGKADRVAGMLNDIAAWTKDNEPGTLKYAVFREDKGDESKVIVIEQYESEDAFKAHMTGPKLKDLGKIAKEENLLAGPFEVIKVNQVGGYF